MRPKEPQSRPRDPADLSQHQLEATQSRPRLHLLPGLWPAGHLWRLRPAYPSPVGRPGAFSRGAAHEIQKFGVFTITCTGPRPAACCCGSVLDREPPNSSLVTPAGGRFIRTSVRRRKGHDLSFSLLFSVPEPPRATNRRDPPLLCCRRFESRSRQAHGANSRSLENVLASRPADGVVREPKVQSSPSHRRVSQRSGPRVVRRDAAIGETAIAPGLC